jgi:hypothetical protein
VMESLKCFQPQVTPISEEMILIRYVVFRVHYSCELGVVCKHTFLCLEDLYASSIQVV